MDQLKATWESAIKEIEADVLLEDESVAQIIHRKSRTELAGIKRSMRLKFFIGSTVALICAASAFFTLFAPQKFAPLNFLFSPVETTLFYLTLTVSLTTMLFFNYRAFREIDFAYSSPQDLRSSLRRFIDAMQRAITFNIYSEALMTPFFVTWFYYAYAYRGQPFTWDSQALILIVLPLLVGFLSFFLQRYAQHLKFGRYLGRLQLYLGDLDQNNAGKV